MSTLNSQLGVVDEVTYGTAVVVDRFFEFNSWGVKLETGRTTTAGARPGSRTMKAGKFSPYILGAAGPFTLDVPTQGWGWWLKHLLGTVTPAGAAVDLNYEHVGTEGNMAGQSFTAQVNKPLFPSGAAQAHTYDGCKLTSWELACDVEGVLVLSGEIDAHDESTDVAMAVASYPADARVFGWEGASVTFDGGAVDISDFKVGCNLGLKTDRRFLRGDTRKKEPSESAWREYSWSGVLDHTSLDQYDRFRATVSQDSMVAIVANFVGPVAHAGATLPRVQIEIPFARVDGLEFDITGPDGLQDQMSGVALDGGVSPVTIRYRSTDATP